MARFNPDPRSFPSLQDRVVVLTGGANGIGAATVDLFYSQGASVVFGDLDDVAGRKVAARYDSKRAHFIKTDVTSYDDNLALFRYALRTYRVVDHAIAIAGVTEQGNVFDPALTVEDVEKPPTVKVLDINLLGPYYLARIAAAYLHHNASSRTDKSITFISSVSGFAGSPGLFAYTASKHGVVGLSRALTHYLPHTHGIRINTICPLATATAMFPPVFENDFRENGLPVNSPLDVAKVILSVVAGSHQSAHHGGGNVGSDEKTEGGPKAAAEANAQGEESTGTEWVTPRKDAGAEALAEAEIKATEREETKGPNGMTLYVEGGRAWDIEPGLAATREIWMGKEQSVTLRKAGELLAMGAEWSSVGQK